MQSKINKFVLENSKKPCLKAEEERCIRPIARDSSIDSVTVGAVVELVGRVARQQANGGVIRMMRWKRTCFVYTEYLF